MGIRNRIISVKQDGARGRDRRRKDESIITGDDLRGGRM
jgi:hypothetical protein